MPLDFDKFTPLRSRSVRRVADDWLADAEPRLADVFADPMIHAVMRRDGVSQAQLRAIVARAQACLRGDPCCRCAA